jgi:hypothetical protein
MAHTVVFSRVVQWPTQSRHLNFTIWPHSLASVFLGHDGFLWGYLKVTVMLIDAISPKN